MKIITTERHQHNLDRTAVIVWDDKQTLDTVYRVMAGYIATIGQVGAFDETFATKDQAIAALTAFRSKIKIEPMY